MSAGSNESISADDSLRDDDEGQWSNEDLEAAYLRALDALEAVESDVVAIAEEVAPGRMEALAEEEAAATRVTTTAPAVVSSEDAPPPVSADQIIEACLFVGGPALTAAKLASVLRGDYTAQYVESAIERLNVRYLAEARPYEVRLAEGGYRLAVREEYERIRHKVFGLGPKEVRLNQDALEVLALVAYHQPVTEARLEELGRANAGGTLRLLLRRDLIAVDRQADQPREIRYLTTERFLSLFGIRSLNELPRPDDLMFK